MRSPKEKMGDLEALESNMKTVKEEFRKEGTYDGADLIHPVRRFLLFIEGVLHLNGVPVYIGEDGRDNKDE